MIIGFLIGSFAVFDIAYSGPSQLYYTLISDFFLQLKNCFSGRRQKPSASDRPGQLRAWKGERRHPPFRFGKRAARHLQWTKASALQRAQADAFAERLFGFVDMPCRYDSARVPMCTKLLRHPDHRPIGLENTQNEKEED